MTFSTGWVEYNNIIFLKRDILEVFSGFHNFVYLNSPLRTFPTMAYKEFTSEKVFDYSISFSEKAIN